MNINLDKLSFMPNELKAVINILNDHSKEIYEEEPNEEDEGKKAIEPEHLKIVNNLDFITSYGDGYFAGALDKYTLVREKDTGHYYWFYLHCEREIFKVYPVKKEEIETLIIEDDARAIEMYIEALEDSKGLPYVKYKEDDFKIYVWMRIAACDYELRQEFKKFIKVQNEKYQENLLSELQIKNNNFYLHDGKLYARTATGQLFELRHIKK
ncbi:hypothetical protein [Priestia megaterium]|uniref:hypothetical protein n=1 Tax=Priestia megaterium TaxID=1404 RepID=UPI00310179C1